jgi:hypothetical protein
MERHIEDIQAEQVENNDAFRARAVKFADVPPLQIAPRYTAGRPRR